MKQIILPDSGITLNIDRIPEFLRLDIRNGVLSRFPKPKPPKVKVTLGVDNFETEQENKADPAYAESLKEHSVIVGRALLEELVEVSTTCEVDQSKVDRLRAWAKRSGADLPQSDVVLYVTRIALETKNDIDFFRNAVLELSQPTEKAIEQSLNNFRTPNGAGVKRPDLQGA